RAHACRAPTTPATSLTRPDPAAAGLWPPDRHSAAGPSRLPVADNARPSDVSAPAQSVSPAQPHAPQPAPDSRPPHVPRCGHAAGYASPPATDRIRPVGTAYGGTDSVPPPFRPAIPRCRLTAEIACVAPRSNTVPQPCRPFPPALPPRPLPRIACPPHSRTRARAGLQG